MYEPPRGMSADLHEALAVVLGAVVIYSPFVFSFAGEEPIDVRTVQLAPNTGGLMASPWESTEADPLVRAIQATLYDRCYTHRLGRRGSAPTQAVAPDAEFACRLAGANVSHEHWDKGWVIQQLGPSGQVLVRKGERERVAMPGAFISERLIGITPQIGASVSIHAPRETFDVQPGYYFAFGETLDELADQLSLVRFYFHCDADGAMLLTAGLTSALNRFQVPFQLKVPVARTLYGRTDAAVLYIGARYFTVTAMIVAQARETVPLESDVPLFTKRLWPGISIAVEPGSGESFGMHRCRLAAEGIVDAWRHGNQDVPARFAASAARFDATGLDLTRPWLGPGGVDLFSLPEPPRLP
jgi:hypothetical protein